MIILSENKNAVQKLREIYWGKKKARKISTELKEIFEKYKSDEDPKKNQEPNKHVAISHQTGTQI